MSVGEIWRMGNDPSSMLRADTSAHSVQRRGVSRVRAEKRKGTDSRSDSGSLCLMLNNLQRIQITAVEKTACVCYI